MVVWFIRSILAVGQNGGAKSAARISQVNPLVRWHFELLGLSSRPLDRANVPVVGSHLVRSRERESRFQVRLFGVPINNVRELYTLSSITKRKANRLNKL